MQKVLIQYLGAEFEDGQVVKGHSVMCDIKLRGDFSLALEHLLTGRKETPITVRVVDSQNEFIITKQVAMNSIFMYIND